MLDLGILYRDPRFEGSKILLDGRLYRLEDARATELQLHSKVLDLFSPLDPSHVVEMLMGRIIREEIALLLVENQAELLLQLFYLAD